MYDIFDQYILSAPQNQKQRNPVTLNQKDQTPTHRFVAVKYKGRKCVSPEDFFKTLFVFPGANKEYRGSADTILSRRDGTWDSMLSETEYTSLYHSAVRLPPGGKTWDPHDRWGHHLSVWSSGAHTPPLFSPQIQVHTQTSSKSISIFSPLWQNPAHPSSGSSPPQWMTSFARLWVAPLSDLRVCPSWIVSGKSCSNHRSAQVATENREDSEWVHICPLSSH